MQTIPKERLFLIYPETDGEPMAENTLQFEWITLIKQGLEACFVHKPDVFVAGDLFWYPVENHPEIRQAPDVLVVLGRPKGHRGSYMQFFEENIAPQVVFEILSPGNRAGEMIRKFQFYQKYGVQEYYIYDPDKNKLEGFIRNNGELEEIENTHHWVSPLLGISFKWTPETLEIYQPDGVRFKSHAQIIELQRKAEAALRLEKQKLKATKEQLKEEKQKVEEEKLKVEEEKRRAEEEKNRAEEEKNRAEEEKRRATAAQNELLSLKEKLRKLGIDSDQL